MLLGLLPSSCVLWNVDHLKIIQQQKDEAIKKINLISESLERASFGCVSSGPFSRLRAMPI